MTRLAAVRCAARAADRAAFADDIKLLAVPGAGAERASEAAAVARAEIKGSR